jgi:hypothetical protein
MNEKRILPAISDPRREDWIDGGLFSAAAGAGTAIGPAIETKAAASRRTPQGVAHARAAHRGSGIVL